MKSCPHFPWCQVWEEKQLTARQLSLPSAAARNTHSSPWSSISHCIELPVGYTKLPIQHRQLLQQGNIHQEGHRKAQKQNLNTFEKKCLCQILHRKPDDASAAKPVDWRHAASAAVPLLFQPVAFRKCCIFQLYTTIPCKTHPISPKPRLNLLKPVVPLTCWQLRQC